jgi:hypothetical protein
MLADFLSELNLPAGWEQWGIIAAGVAVTGLALVVGRRMLASKRPAGLPNRAAGLIETSHDPFDAGSLSEKRVALRRKGSPIEVLVTDVNQSQTPYSTWVLDRSLSGLGLSSDHEVPAGTILKVRPKNAPPATPWIEVEVRSCKPDDKVWQLGVSFRKTPPYGVLLLFG